MATTGIRVTGAITGFFAATSAAVYAAPANSYAIVTVMWNNGGAASSNIQLSIDGLICAVGQTGASGVVSNSINNGSGGTQTGTTFKDIYIGPGQTLSYGQSSGFQVTISGVQFGP